MITDFSSITPWGLTDLFLWVCWNRLFSQSPSISALRATHSGLSSNIGMFRLKLLISFLFLSIAGSNWLAHLGRSTQDRASLSWSQADLQLHWADPFSLLCVDTFSCRHTFWHARWDPTIVMATHDNRDSLMVPCEDLPNEDKDIISKAIEEF